MGSSREGQALRQVPETLVDLREVGKRESSCLLWRGHKGLKRTLTLTLTLQTGWWRTGGARAPLCLIRGPDDP